jgi:hypothetical protein
VAELELLMGPPGPVVNQDVKTVVFTVVPLVIVVEMLTGLTTPLLELAAVPDTKVEEAGIRDVFVQDEGDAVNVDPDPLHPVEELVKGGVALQELRGIELAVPIDEPVLVLVMVMGTTDEPPVGATVVIQIVDKLKEFVNDHDKLPALMLHVGDDPDVEFVAGRGLIVIVTTLAVVVEPVPLGLITVPDKVSVELRVVGKGGLLEPGVFVGSLVQESQVVLNGVTDVPWVPD